MNNTQLDITLFVKEKQAVHGMLHKDYIRYQQYCSKKLRTLRQHLNLMHGKGGLRKKPLPGQKQVDKSKPQQQQPAAKSQQVTGKNTTNNKQQTVSPQQEKEFAFVSRKITSAADYLDDQMLDETIDEALDDVLDELLDEVGVSEEDRNGGSMRPSEQKEQKRGQQLLSIPLVQAERNWCYAMELKQMHAEDPTEPSKKKYHYKKRLAKAVMWAERLEVLSAEIADQRTHVEAEAYRNWMQGTMCVEKNKWKEALEKFLSSRTVYEQLSQASTLGVAHKEACRSKIEEIDLAIRICRYNISREGGDKNRENMADLAESQALSSPAMQVLRSKLQAVLDAEARGGATAAASVSLKWIDGKTSISVSSDKIKQLISNAESSLLETKQCTTVEAKLKLYERILSSLVEAQRQIREEMKNHAANHASSEQIANTRLLYTYASYLFLQRTLERNLYVAQQMVSKLSLSSQQSDASVSSGAQKKAKKSGASAIDVVRLYDVVLQNLNELQQLPGLAEANQSLFKRLQSQYASYNAFRCFYLAESHAEAAEWRESYALLDRVTSLLQVASASQQAIKDNLTDVEDEQKSMLLPDLAKLKDKIEVAQLHARAQHVIQQQQKALQKQQLAGHVLPATSVGGDRKVDVISNLDKFEVDPRGRILLASFPPSFENVPAKPVFFDIASNSLQYPDVSSIVPKEETKKEEQPDTPKKKWFGLF